MPTADPGGDASRGGWHARGHCSEVHGWSPGWWVPCCFSRLLQLSQGSPGAGGFWGVCLPSSRGRSLRWGSRWPQVMGLPIGAPGAGSLGGWPACRLDEVHQQLRKPMWVLLDASGWGHALWLEFLPGVLLFRHKCCLSPQETVGLLSSSSLAYTAGTSSGPFTTSSFLSLQMINASKGRLGCYAPIFQPDTPAVRLPSP